MPNLRNKKPTMPIAIATCKSKVDPLSAYAPNSAKQEIPANKYGRGIFNNCTQTRTSGKFITNSKVFPINKLAIKVQIKSGLVANNIGPASI